MPGLWFWTDKEIEDLTVTLRRIETKVDKLLQSGSRIEEMEMTEREEIDRLKQTVAQNTDVVQSATAALAGYVQTVQDLTTQLQEAIAEDNSAAIKEAADAIVANNQMLQQSIPEVAQAVKQGTKS